jgi:hypothetical protein
MKRFDMRVSLAACFAAMALGAVAHADAFIIGSGQGSCGKFIASLGDVPPGKYRKMNTAKGDFVDEHKVYQEWLLGFVSGYNATLSAFNASHPGEEQQSLMTCGCSS